VEVTATLAVCVAVIASYVGVLKDVESLKAQTKDRFDELNNAIREQKDLFLEIIGDERCRQDELLDKLNRLEGQQIKLNTLVQQLNPSARWNDERN